MPIDILMNNVPELQKRLKGNYNIIYISKYGNITQMNYGFTRQLGLRFEGIALDHLYLISKFIDISMNDLYTQNISDIDFTKNTLKSMDLWNNLETLPKATIKEIQNVIKSVFSQSITTLKNINLLKYKSNNSEGLQMYRACCKERMIFIYKMYEIDKTDEQLKQTISKTRDNKRLDYNEFDLLIDYMENVVGLSVNVLYENIEFNEDISESYFRYLSRNRQELLIRVLSSLIIGYKIGDSNLLKLF